MSSTAATPAIEVEQLTKRFGDQVADDAVSFRVRPGETFGLLGPNGAGKTTLIRMLTTLLPPTSGTARIEGRDVISERGAVRRLIGTVSQAETTDENLTVRENLSVQGKMYGLSGRRLSERIERRLRQVGLWERRQQPARQLSGGMRRRLEIARGVLHSPRVLFLDEPTTGLDPQSRRSIWDMFDDMRERDPELAIVLTTHAMEEADYLCDRIAIMDHGVVIASGTLEELIERTVGRDREVVLTLDRPVAAALEGFAPAENGTRIRARIADVGAELPGLIERVRRQGLGVADLALERHGLHEVFLRLTGKELRE